MSCNSIVVSSNTYNKNLDSKRLCEDYWLSNRITSCQDAIIFIRNHLRKVDTKLYSSTVSNKKSGLIQISIPGELCPPNLDIHKFYFDLDCIKAESPNLFLHLFCSEKDSMSISNYLDSPSSELSVDVTIDELAAFGARIKKDSILEISWHLVLTSK